MCPEASRSEDLLDNVLAISALVNQIDFGHYLLLI